PLLTDDVRPCDSFVCTSRAAKQATERLLAHVKEDFDRAHGTRLQYRGRVDIVPLSVDVERFKPGDKPALRAALGLAADEFIILWHGRMSAADKADLLPLMRVFQRLIKANPQKRLRLILAGTDIKVFPFVPFIEMAAEDLGIGAQLTVLEGF